MLSCICISNIDIWGKTVKRIIGFALFFVAVGMTVMIFLPNVFTGVILIMLCLVIAYCLFCC